MKKTGYPKRPFPSGALVALFLVGLGGSSAEAEIVTQGRTRFPNSISAVAAGAQAAAPNRPTVVRSTLRPEESAASMDFEVALRMRNFPELQARVARGELIPAAEMAEKYFPTAADHDRVAQWIRSQGLAVVRTDSNHLAVFGRGSVAAVQQAFQVTFARVASRGQEFTSAVTAPSLPIDFAPAVQGIHGLQPHLRPHPLAQRKALRPDATGTTAPPYLPGQIASVYNASGLSVTGAGQTIAVISNAFPSTSDLTAFWSAAGVSASAANIQTVTVDGGPASPADSGSLEEVSLDVEWSSSLAPGAVIRIYGSNIDDAAGFDKTFQQVYADLTSQPGMHQFSISFGENESEYDRDYLTIEAQYMATLASAGVSVFAASGDGGSNPNPEDGQDYTASDPLDVSYPASDPSVTGVGGTSLTLNASGGVASETVWFSDGGGSGGGPSSYFARPSWQTGTGVGAGSTRLTPDVASVGDPNTGAVTIISGKRSTIGGTSWGTPTWAAFCALINQARASSGMAPLGILNPKLYPLIGTSAFRDITAGSNGAYSAGVGFDLCTGLGVPNVAALIASLGNAGAAPAITAQLGNRVVVVGQPVTFAVAAAGTPTLSYQWQRAPSGTGTFAPLSDNATYGGSATSDLVVSGTTFAMNGDQFQCVVSNSAGSTVSSPASTLTVNSVGVTTLAGWPSAAGSVDATGSAARFNFLGSVRTDAAGNIYVADGGNYTIRKITPAGVVTTIAGAAGVTGSNDGPGSAARFNAPAAVAVDAGGNLYVADALNYNLRKITPDGTVSTLAGLAGSEGTADGTGTAARFYDPEDLAVDSAGTIWVADGRGDTIRMVSPSGVVTTVAGSPRSSGSANGTGSAARFNNVLGIIVDGAGNVYVSDSNNNTIRKMTPAFAVTTLAGSSGRSGSADGTGSVARFSAPGGLAVDPAGNVYVADSDNNTIREITPAGIVTTIAGAAGVIEATDGLGSAARFDLPTDVAVDSAGILYVSDADNFTVRRLVTGGVVPPVILAQPSAASITTGQNTSFTVVASGSVPLSYQWQQLTPGNTAWGNLSDNATFSGTATATLTITGATSLLDGSQFQCVVQNNAGSATSAAVTLSVAGAPVVFALSPPQSVVPGASVTLSVTAGGEGLSYQWRLGATDIPGATSATLTLNNFAAANAGVYSVVISNAYGTLTQTVATLSLTNARLINLSARAFVGTGSNALVTGFVVSGTASKQVLNRGAGPALGLAPFSLTGVLAQPMLTLFNSSGAVLATNTSWGGGAALAADFTAVGAFPFATNSNDTAIYTSLAPGSYTAQITGVGGTTGIALGEIYDADSGTPVSRLVNISARASVGTGGNILISGFMVGGSGSETVLIRAVGPTLGAAPFNLAGVLANPVLTVYDSAGHVIAANVGWGNSPTLGTSQVQAVVAPASAAIMASVGAFALPANSADSALVLTLPPGAYTAQVNGANGTSGTAIVEVYEVAQ